jgi:type IV pilus assembly protein PilA
MRDNKGFTLIELLIVVVIIGILASIAIPKFSATREKAYFATMRSDLKNLASQQEIYFSDHYVYSDNLTNLGFNASQNVTIGSITATVDGWGTNATHSGMTNRGCAYQYGTNASASTPGGVNANNSGEMVCDS